MDSNVLMIDPSLFTRLMRLPDAARCDLLEFIGATPVANTELSQMIDTLSKAGDKLCRSPRLEAN